MQRDLDLIRKLLAYFDEKPGTGHVLVPDLGAGYTESQIKYHLNLLYQAGFLNCEPVKSKTSDRIIYVLPFDLTWDGHEFLDKIRNDGVWSKVKATVAARGGSLGFTLASQLATRFALRELGFHD